MSDVRHLVGMATGRPLARASAERAVALFGLITVAYVIGAELSWHSFGSGLAFGFPPAGVDVAALLLTARRRSHATACG
jgi:hypothetical protein